MTFPCPAIYQTQELICHPLTPSPTVRSLTAGVRRMPEGDLLFSYYLAGDMAQLLIPQTQASLQSDELWEHTCFEAFISIEGDTAYRELNFSPSGQWAYYVFSGYRIPIQADTLLSAPEISTQLTDGHLKLDAIISRILLPTNANALNLRIGLSAVIETKDTVDGYRSYWALSHPAEKPDFHHADSFTLEMLSLTPC